MNNRLNYWRNRWENNNVNDDIDLGFADSPKFSDVKHTLDLLREYTGASPTLGNFFSTNGLWGGTFGRFFNGHWNTHHGDVVQEAIANYFHAAGTYKWDSAYHKTQVVLALLKKNIGHKSVNPDGDLGLILRVIKEKTQIDYYQIDVREYFNLGSNGELTLKKNDGEKYNYSDQDEGDSLYQKEDNKSYRVVF